MAPKAPAAWVQIIDDYMLTLAAAGQPPTTTELRRIQFVRIARAIGGRPADVAREKFVGGSGGRPDGRSKRAAATAPASADSSGGHTEPSGFPTIWPTSCPRYASNVGNAGAAAGARPP